MFYYPTHISPHHTPRTDLAPSARARVVVALHEEREIVRLTRDLGIADQQFGAWLRSRA